MRRIIERAACAFRRAPAKMLAFTAAAALCFGLLLASGIQIVSILAQRGAAAREYGGLAAQYSPAAQNPQSAGTSGALGAQSAAPQNQGTGKSPADLNPDYVGWLQVPGGGVDYPVARGADNLRYLSTTFEGNLNAAGAIFMDSANTENFSSPHAVVYGHNMKDGSMFGGLHKYLDAEYLAKNPVLTVTTASGETLSYLIFAARVTDAWDPAYQLSFADGAAFTAFAAGLGAPQGTARLLTLSTCTNVDDDERILLHAAAL